MPDVTCNSISLLDWVPSQASSIPPAPASGPNMDVVRPPSQGHLVSAYAKHRGTQAGIRST